MITNAKRNKIIEEAEEWLGTPFHHRARVKGIGVDCLQFVIACYLAAKLLPKNIDNDIYNYSNDEHMNNREEQFIEALLSHGWVETKKAQKGDVLIFKVGKRFSHGVLVIKEGYGIHSYLGKGVVYTNYLQDAELKNRDYKVFTMGEGDI